MRGATVTLYERTQTGTDDFGAPVLKGVPASLLTGDSEEACRAQADAILAFAKPSGYPNLPDGGEARAPKGTSTRDQFAAWAESQL